jgi:tetratricopeptide (TPR) repeat protein
MDNFTQREEILIKYFDGLMSQEEKSVFEKNLSIDAILRDELENLQITRSAIKAYGLKETVASIHSKMMIEFKEKNPVRNISSLRKIVAVAASIIFIFLAVQGWIFYNLSAGKVFTANYIQYVPDGFRDGSTNISASQKAYMENDYKKVIQLAAGSESPNDHFLAAHAQLALNNAEAAVDGFKKVIASSDKTKTTELKDAAEYNLVLSLIKNKDYDLALDLMKKIKENPAHLYYKNITSKLFRQVKMLKWR